MGYNESKQERMFLSLFKHMMAGRGLQVSEKVLKDFLDFVKKVSPWFLEEGTLNLSDWKQVDKEMRKHVQEHGEEELPKHAYPLWLQMRGILANDSDFEGLIHETLSVDSDQEAKPLNNPIQPHGTDDKKPPFETLETNFKSDGDEDSNDSDFEEAFKHGPSRDRDHYYAGGPPYTTFPAKRTEKYRKRRPLAPSGFQAAMEEARRTGEVTFSFPVAEGMQSERPVWEPLSLKTLKELQLAVKTSGASAPYTLQVLDVVASHWLTPYDWHQTAKATLSPGDYILWRTEYEDRSKQTVTQFLKRRGPKPDMDMLLGT